MNKFIDDEAEASNGSEEEDYEEMQSEYEDVLTELDEPDMDRIRTLLVSTEPVDKQAEFEEFVDEMIQSAKEREEVSRRFCSGAATYDLDPPGSQEGDSPIWRINCRIGTEEMAVLYLLQTAHPLHGLKSAFTRSAIPGCIYVESRLDKKALDLLSKAPGVIIGKSGVKKTLIDPHDHAKILTMKCLNSDFAEGDWVQIKKGLYKGDLGLVDRVHGWGLTVLLIPRIRPNLDEEQKKKRKITYLRPTPRLFDPKEFEGSAVMNMRHIDGSKFLIGGLRLQSGLLSKDYEFSSVKGQPQTIPYDMFRLFEFSKHHRVQTSECLRPQEWHFMIGDRVYDALTGAHGTVEGLSRTHLEVDIGEEEVTPISWRHAMKIFVEGEYVTVASGIHAGRSGWIVSVKEDVATILEEGIDSAYTHSKEQTLKQIDVFVNSVKTGTSTASSRSSETSIQARQENRIGNRHPWIGIKVLISRQGHPRKGDTGIVIAVLPPAADSRIQRIEIQLTKFDPVAPFTKVIIDSTDVVLERSHQQLPVTASEILNLKAQIAHQSEIDSMLNGSPVQGGQTPMPNHASLTPAWDPSSNISEWTIPDTPSSSIVLAEALSMSNTHSESAPSTEIEYAKLDHILLNPVLAGAAVFVTEKAEPSKSISVTLHCDNGTMSMRRIQYHMSVDVIPDSVIPKHPSPTHDNGLLLVIQGEHCGKYARRLYHRHRQGQSTLIIVRVVKVAIEEGAQNILTEEELELNVEHLVTVDESAAQKKLNKRLMIEARQEYKNRK